MKRKGKDELFDILSKYFEEIEDESMIRIVKLHGDYKRKILPYTEGETFQFEKEVEKCLKRLTMEGIVFVGYSGMDRDVLKCLSQEGGSVWWVNPRKVTADIFFKKIHERISVRDINTFCDQFKFGATRYRKMKDLFEPPYQYDEMKRKLNEHRVLLILGEAHLGKDIHCSEFVV